MVTQTGKVYTLEGEKLEIDNILRVSEGTNHALFLTKEGTGYSIGANSNGQLGDGTTVSKNSPTVIKTEKSNLTDIKELKSRIRKFNGNNEKWRHIYMGEATTTIN